MKYLFILILALLVSNNAVYAFSNTLNDPPISSNSEKENEDKNNNKEEKSKKTEVKKTVAVISGADLHKLKFPKKFASKKVKYTYRKKLL